MNTWLYWFFQNYFFLIENARKPDESDHGDPITLVSLYCAWLKEKSKGGGRAWCRRRGIEEQRLYEMTKLAAQLKTLLQVLKSYNILPRRCDTAFVVHVFACCAGGLNP